MASLDWSQCSAVESIPGKVSGAWVFVPRVPIAAVLRTFLFYRTVVSGTQRTRRCRFGNGRIIDSCT
jgi:hypothetical protein